MKKRTIPMVLAMVATFASDSLFAQPSEISSRLSQTFDQQFGNTSRVRWTATPNAFVVTFVKDEQPLIAVYTSDEAHVATGRLISDNTHLPMAVQKGLQREQARCEKKYGVIETGYVFEMNEDNHQTRYFVAIQTNKQTLNFVLLPDGSSSLRRAVPNLYPALDPEMVIASGK